MYKLKLLLCLGCIIPFGYSFSQTQIPELVATPNAANIAKYGDIPVSYYTGSANINVPLYSFTQNKVALDISLNYDTSGLPINMLPGWTGHGWTLQAGGSITRVVNRSCDEFIDSSSPSSFHNYFQSYATLAQESNLYTLRQELMSNYSDHDYEADIFYFNFLGKNGYFFLGSDGDWKVSSDQNIDVEFDYSNPCDTNSFIYPFIKHMPDQQSLILQPKTIKGFTIYDEEGNKYVFGGSHSSIEYSVDLFSIPYYDTTHPWFAKSWYLTEVRDRFNHLLYRFNYEEGKYFIQLFRNYSSTQIIGGSQTENRNAPNYSGTLNRPVYLSSIEMRDHRSLHFSRSSVYPCGQTAQTLYPSIYNNNGNLNYYLITGSYGFTNQFYYIQSDTGEYTVCSSPFNNPFAGIDLLKLDSVYLQSGNNHDILSVYKLSYSTVNRLHLTQITNSYLSSLQNGSESISSNYHFKYNDYHQVEPDYLTNKHDAWGYQNMSAASSEPTDYGNPRPSPNSYSQIGMLQEIIYPTGGKTVLEYELHDYSSCLSLDRQSMLQEPGTAGGLRIKSIKEYDDSLGTVLLSNRQFSYIYPSTQSSSGQLFALPKYSWSWITSGETYSLEYTHDEPVIPLATSFGTHIGYSFVTEYFSDGTNKTYQYSNFSDVKDEPFILHAMETNTPTPPTPFDKFGERNFMRGRLLCEKIYSSNNQILQERRFTYRTDTSTMNTRYSLASNINELETQFASSEIYTGGIFKRYYPRYDIETAITTQYTSTGSIKDSTVYQNKDNYVILELPLGVHAPYFRKCIKERTLRGSETKSKDFTYSGFNESMYYQPLSSTISNFNNSHVLTEQTIYNNYENTPQPAYDISYKSINSKDTLVTYNAYENGQLITYTRKGEYPTQLYWDTYGRLIASVTSPYSRGQITCNASFAHFTSYSEASQNTFRILEYNNISIFDMPNTKATVYSYDDNGLLRATVMDNKVLNFYDYDGLGRLTKTLDGNRKTLQRFTYHYSSGN